MIAALCLSLSTALAAQTQLAKAKELYAAASFDEALAVLDRTPAADGIEPVEYRILCLLALERPNDAQLAIETLLTLQPKYRPDASLMSPRMRAEFEAARGRIIRRRYDEAKASFDAKDFRTAEVRFNRMLDMAAGAEDPALADLKFLAYGFRDLARGMGSSRAADSAQAAAAPTSRDKGRAPAPAPLIEFAGAVDGIYDASAGNVVAPVPLKPILPPVSPAQVVAVPRPGLFEVVIDERGRVESMVVRRSVSTEYDALVLKESREWRYRPATRDGRPVKFRKVIEIYTASLRSMKRDY